jgi:hypothetical protein
MPVNADPAPFGGNIVVLDPESDSPLIRILTKTDPPVPHGTPRYKSHFTTCTKAAEHRVTHCKTCGKPKSDAPFGENCRCPL